MLLHKLSLIIISLGLLNVGIGGSAHAASCLPAAPNTPAQYENVLKQPIDGTWYRGDSGQSVVLPNGKTLYVFGDTIMGPASATWANGAIHNSAILVTGGCATALTGPRDANGKATDWMKVPAALDVPNVSDYYWASTPYMDGSTLRMFLLHEYNDANGFHAIGSDIATFSLTTGTPVLKSIKATPSSRATAGPVWGAAVVRDASYTYIYGSRYKGEFLTFGHHYYVARVANNSDETVLSNWRYWNGASWSTNQTSAAEIISGVNGPGTDGTAFSIGGTYMLISKANDMLGSSLNYWTAPTPAGPWQAGTAPLISPIPNVNAAGGELTYLGLAHPGQPLASGKLLVSWSLNSSDAAFFGNPRYGVYFSEVDIPTASRARTK